MANHIFISYSKKDSPFVHNLADDLANRGVDVWIDRSIGGGEEWRETIIRNLKKAKGISNLPERLRHIVQTEDKVGKM